jgi:adenosine deaminase
LVLKAELHCHIEGAAEPELVTRLAHKHNIDVSGVIDAQGKYLWSDFVGFQRVYDLAASVFRTPEDFQILAYDHYTRLAAQDCIYAEIFVSPDHAASVGLGYLEMIDAIALGMNGAKSETGIEGRIIVVGVRNLGPEAVEKAADKAANFPHPLVTGFGLAGEERMFMQEDFANAFSIAGDAGLSLTAHAGELVGPESIRGAIDHLGVTRIGHGVRAIEDPLLVCRLIEESITLEACPGSNIALDVFQSFEKHSFKKLLDEGVQMTLSSDDPPFFHTSLNNEYEIAAKYFGMNDRQLLEITRASIEAAFVDEPTRNKLLIRLDKST